MRHLCTVLLISSLLVLVSCAPGTSSREGVASESAVSFRLASLDGGRLGTEDFRGQVVIFDFWATWCRPCHVQADILATIVPEFEQHGVAFVAVNLGEPVETVRAFTSKRPFPYPVIVDPDDELAHKLGIYVLPTVLILGPGGEIIYLREGVSSARRLREVLEEALEPAATASL